MIKVEIKVGFKLFFAVTSEPKRMSVYEKQTGPIVIPNCWLLSPMSDIATSTRGRRSVFLVV